MCRICFWNHLHRPQVLTPGTLCRSAATRSLPSYMREQHILQLTFVKPNDACQLAMMTS